MALEAKDVVEVYVQEMTIEGTSWMPWDTFRRSGPHAWSVLMGSSWEDVNHGEEPLEAAYQVWLHK